MDLGRVRCSTETRRRGAASRRGPCPPRGAFPYDFEGPLTKIGMTDVPCSPRSCPKPPGSGPESSRWSAYEACLGCSGLRVWKPYDDGAEGDSFLPSRSTRAPVLYRDPSLLPPSGGGGGIVLRTSLVGGRLVALLALRPPASWFRVRLFFALAGRRSCPAWCARRDSFFRPPRPRARLRGGEMSLSHRPRKSSPESSAALVSCRPACDRPPSSRSRPPSPPVGDDRPPVRQAKRSSSPGSV